jgi:cytohesin
VDAKSTDGSIPLHGAAFWGLKEVAELLIAKGADVNVKDYKGVTPLHDAALWGHKEIAELLLANGADVDAKDEDGDTPLDVAILRNDKETADLLRKHGGKTTEELEEIFHAIEDGDFEAVNKAISDGFDFNNAIFEGQTPLHMAADLGYKEIVELLLTNGADVNAKDYKGVTPLHDAALWGHKEIAELLLAKGADVNAKANDGKTPLDWAIEKNRTETADLLRKHGGKTGDELALMPHLVYAKGPFGVSFTAKDGETYVVEVTQDLKQWGELETIKGTGKQVKFTDPRQPLVPFKRNFYRVKLVE